MQPRQEGTLVAHRNPWRQAEQRAAAVVPGQLLRLHPIVEGADPRPCRGQPQPVLPVPQGGIGPAALAQVEQGADHADRTSLRIADDVATVQHIRVAAIGPAETVFRRPARASSGDHRIDALVHPRPVLGMDLGEPPVAGRLHLPGRPAIGIFQRLVPEHAVVREAPVPDRVAGRPLRKTEALVDGFQRLACEVLLGPVPQQLEVAGMGTPLVPQRHHLAGSPEAGAILAPVPAFVGGPAVPGRPIHLDFREAGRPILRHEDHIRRPTEHLGLRPAQDIRCPGVPAADPAHQIRADDGEVVGAVQDLPPQRLGPGLPRQAQSQGELAHHLPGQRLQNEALPGRKALRPGLRVEDAQRAQG